MVETVQHLDSLAKLDEDVQAQANDDLDAAFLLRDKSPFGVWMPNASRRSIDKQRLRAERSLDTVQHHPSTSLKDDLEWKREQRPTGIAACFGVALLALSSNASASTFPFRGVHSSLPRCKVLKVLKIVNVIPEGPEQRAAAA